MAAAGSFSWRKGPHATAPGPPFADRSVRVTIARTLLAIFLTALVAVTAVGTASARGAMAADGVICGTGQYTVILAADGLPLFDAGGAPVEAEQLPCLDCVFAQMALVPANSLPTTIRTTSTDLSTTPPPHLSPGLWRMGGQGRSPPAAA